MRFISFLVKMSIEAVEYRSVIKFLILRNTSNSDIIIALRDAYKEQCPSNSTMYRWINAFRGGRTSVFDDEKSGRPVEIPQEKSDQLIQIIRDERRITVSHLADKLNVSVGHCHNMMRDLGIRKLCSRFVPYFISEELCNRRKTCCLANLQTHGQYGDLLLKNLVTEDETPLSLYVPESKRSSAEWKLPEESASKKLRSSTVHRRCMMLSVFWDYHGLIKVDFADSSTKINAEYYTALLNEARRLRRKPRGTPLFFLHDNAPIHTANLTVQAVTGCGFTQLQHPPYSPDLAPSDFWLFKYLKKHLAGRRFTTREEVAQEVQSFFANQEPKFYADAFLELVRRWEKCVERNGSYIEK